MITSSFTEWVKIRQLNEVRVEGGGITSSFLNMLQRPGDIVLYDVHGLSKMIRGLPEGQMLPELSLADRVDRVGKITGADPVKRKVFSTRPQTLSYQKFKKSKGKELKIPLKSLENVTELFPESETEDKNIWLAVDDNTPFQGRLAEVIRKARQARYAEPAALPEPEEAPVSPEMQDMFPAAALQTPTQAEPMANWDAIAPPDEPKQGALGVWRDRNKERTAFQQLGEPKYQMQGREVIPTDSDQMAALGQGLRQHKKRTPPVDPEIDRIKRIMASSFDPSILSHDRNWKFYTEAKTYSYH